MNLNDEVQVTLTSAGRACQGDDYWTDSEKNGRWQLWRFMQTFGPHPYHGMPEVLFERNEAACPE